MSWLNRLTTGLSKTSRELTTGLNDLVTKRPLDQPMLDALEEALISADMGTVTASQIIKDFASQRFGKQVDEAEVKQALASQIADILAPLEAPFVPASTPHIVLVVGVNGNGKTTSIGKVAHYFTAQGKRVLLAAGDTFRAAATEQLQRWAERTGAAILTAAHEADPASLAYQAVEKAQKEGFDLVLIDTAGRLHTKHNLMEELKKIVRVIQKIVPDAPHHIIQVIDATTGQNALQQIEAFSAAVPVNGLIITKLDGTAKAGILAAIRQRFNIPVYFIGVGEQADDMQPFQAREFALSLMGLANLSE